EQDRTHDAADHEGGPEDLRHSRLLHLVALAPARRLVVEDRLQRLHAPLEPGQGAVKILRVLARHRVARLPTALALLVTDREPGRDHEDADDRDDRNPKGVWAQHSSFSRTPAPPRRLRLQYGFE